MIARIGLPSCTRQFGGSKTEALRPEMRFASDLFRIFPSLYSYNLNSGIRAVESFAAKLQKTEQLVGYTVPLHQNADLLHQSTMLPHF